MIPSDILPALDPNEWEERRRGRLYVVQDGAAPRLVMDDGDHVATVSRADDLFAMIALANDALPDDDPRKITWALLTRVQAMSDVLDGLARSPASTPFLREEADAWRQIVRVLSALLPVANPPA
jgi:hypothetical protein